MLKKMFCFVSVIFVLILFILRNNSLISNSLIVLVPREELQTELGQLSLVDAMTYQPLHEMMQVVDPMIHSGCFILSAARVSNYFKIL